jgi:hypothetical protein
MCYLVALRWVELLVAELLHVHPTVKAFSNRAWMIEMSTLCIQCKNGGRMGPLEELLVSVSYPAVASSILTGSRICR